MSYHEWRYSETAPCCSTKYVWQAMARSLAQLAPKSRILDVGCGNGDLSGRLLALGHTVVGIDLSESGIALARQAHPGCRFELLAADEVLLEKLGEPAFDFVVSTEVVEHLYEPKLFAKGCFDAVRPGGTFVCSTPYHGYLKNLAIASMGGFDKHWSPLWDGGHIKFWSRKTLEKLLSDTGFKNIRFVGAGRMPLLWKSMLMICERP